MSYKIANANAAIEHSGLLNPSKFKNSKVVLSGTPPAGSGYTSGQKFTIGPIKTIGLVDVFTLTGSSNLGILYDEYVHGSTIKVYSINGETLSQLCEGVILFSPTNSLRIPTLDEILLLYNCIIDHTLTGRSEDYSADSLVRELDLLKPEIPSDGRIIKLKFNSKYIQVVGVNRAIIPNISSSDAELTSAHTDPYYLNTNLLLTQCNSYIECRLGDTIDIYTSLDSYYEPYLYCIDAYDVDYFPTSIPEYTPNDLHAYSKKQVRLTINEELLSYIPEDANDWYIFTYCPEYKKAVFGLITNPISVLADGTTYPRYTLGVKYLPTFDSHQIYEFYNGEMLSNSPHGVVYNTDVSVAWTVHPESSLAVLGYHVTIVTAKGEVLQDKYLTDSYTSFIMPKEPVYIYVTVDGIDASVVFSSSLQLLSGINLSRESGNSIFSKYQIRYNVDPGLRITNGEFQGSDWVSPVHPLYDRYFFPIEVRKNIWNNPLTTLKVTVYLKLSSEFEDKLGHMTCLDWYFQNVNIDNITIHEECVDLPDLNIGNTISCPLKKSNSADWDFMFDVVLLHQQVHGLYTNCYGEPIRIKVTEGEHDVRLFMYDMLIADGTKFNMMELADNSSIITSDFCGTIYCDKLSTIDDKHAYNKTTPCYIYIYPVSHIRTIPEYVTPWVNFFKRNVINHDFGCTHENTVALKSELLLPSTVTSLDKLALPYLGFYKVEAPGIKGSIPELCFKSCWNLREFHVPDSVTTIEAKAFGGAGNYYLTGESLYPFTIDLNKVLTIKEGAFAHACIKELTIPKSVTSMPSPLWFVGMSYVTCYIEHLTWDKKTESNTLMEIFTKSILSSLKKLTIGVNVETLPAGFLMIKGDTFLTIEYLGTKEQWSSKFGDRIFTFWNNKKPMTVQCSNGNINYFNS